VAGAGHEVIFAGKAKESRIETHEVAIVFGYSGGEVVVPDLAARARKKLKSMNVTAGERLEALTVRELQVHLSAVAFDQTERIQLTGRTFIYKHPEVAPINIATFACHGLHANKGAACDGSSADGPKVILDNSEAAVIAEWTQALSDDGRVGGRVLLKQFGDGGFEWASLPARSRRAGFCAGAPRYFVRVRRPIRRCCAILRNDHFSTQWRR
jgi:hypothetical protein